MPTKQPKGGRLWLADGSCVRRGRSIAITCGPATSSNTAPMKEEDTGCSIVIDEFSRECLASRVARRLRSTDVIDVLSDLLILRGIPGHVRSDNGPEFIAEAVQAWITAVGAKTAYIALGSPWENGIVESFNVPTKQ